MTWSLLCDCSSARLPLDEKLFERDLQAALHLSKQSAEDEKGVKTGLMNYVINLLLYIMLQEF